MQEVRPVDAPLVHAHGHGGEEEHHEKKPVALKMKEKVKKLKNTVTKKIRGGGDHADDHEHQRDQYHDMDAEEEEEEEEGGYQEDDEDKLVDPEPEVHGAPMYDTATVPDAVTGRESREHENVRARESEEPAKVTFGDVVGSTVEDPAAPNSSTPPPRGGEVISVSPIIQSFEAMSVGDKPEGAAGQRDQLSPVTPSKQGDEEMRDVEFEDLQGAAVGAAPTAPTGSHDQFSPKEPSKQTAEEKQQNQQSYTEKLKSAAAGTTEYGKKIAFVAYDKAAGAGAAAYDKAAGVGAVAYDKAAGVGAVAYDKAAGAGAAVLAKVQPQGGGGAAATSGEEGSGNRDKGVSMREYIAEKLKPGEEHKALSEVISDAMPTRKGPERRGEIDHKESEEVMSGSEGRSGGEEIERMAGDEVTGQEPREEVIAAGGESTERKKAGDEFVTGAETEQKAAEEVKGSTISDERRGGVTMMEKIRGAVTSLISPKSPASDTKERGANANVVEETKQESEFR